MLSNYSSGLYRPFHQLLTTKAPARFESAESSANRNGGRHEASVQHYDDCCFINRIRRRPLRDSKTSCWLKEWMHEKSLGIQHQLYDFLLKQDPGEYRRLLRMPHEVFEKVLASVGLLIEKADTNMR